MPPTRVVNTRPVRSERLEARISRALKDRFQRAASARGLTLTEFVVTAVTEAADRVVREQEIIELTERDQRAFAGALLTPPPLPAPRLVQAAVEHGRWIQKVD